MSKRHHVTGFDGLVPPEHAIARFKTKALARVACDRDGFYKRCARRGEGQLAGSWVVSDPGGAPFTWSSLSVSHGVMTVDAYASNPVPHPDSGTTRTPLAGPLELILPDGSVLRLRWDKGEGGVKVSAETGPDGFAAVDLVVRPRTSNSITLQVGS